MGQEETKQVLEGVLNDDDAAGAVAEGDFSGFADAELTGAERALLQAAASELVDDEVSGFAFGKGRDVKGFGKIPDIPGFSKIPDLKGGPIDPKVKPALRDAFDYINIGN